MNTKQNLGLIAGAFAAVVLPGPTMAQPIRYVDADATGANDGTSWADAFTDLQDALFWGENSGSCTSLPACRIWVAAGTYEPHGSNRFTSFKLVDYVKVYGGFAGTEDPPTFDLRDRDFQANETILSGDLAGNDGPDFVNNGENSYNVVAASGTDRVNKEPRLDGFTITGGNAEAGGLFPGGGGIRFENEGDAAIYNCRIVGNATNNAGGGIYLNLYQNESSPWIVNCVIAHNRAMFGGGIATETTGSMDIANCQILDNEAFGTYGGGGGLYLYKGNQRIVNSLIAGNVASAAPGGGIASVNAARPRLINSTVADNVATTGGGVYVGPSAYADIDNTIIWDNDASEGQGKQIHANVPANRVFVKYSDVLQSAPDVEGNVTFEGDGNIEVNPSFVPGDYRLQEGSLCIDVGLDDLVPDDEWDVDGDSTTTEPTPELDLNPRIVAGPSTNLQCEKVDMGAYEYAVACPSNCFDGDECTPPHQCTDDDVCEYVCRNRIYGDITPFGAVVPPCTAEDRATIGNGFSDMLDVFCAFNGFNGGFPYTLCPCGDVSPCGGDGFVNMLDVLALFDAFGHIYQCDHPCVCDDCGESMAMGGDAPDGSRIVESGDILVGILATIAPVSVDRYKYGVEAIADWLIERMTMDQRSALADKLEDPSQKFANDRVTRMIPAIVSALRGE